MDIYRLEKVKKKYKNYSCDVLALDNLNLSITKEEIIVILGPSGSGKSTLLNVLSGIDKITSGKIYFEDERIDEYDYLKLNNYRRENIGFVFQSYNLLPNLNVYENIFLGNTLETKLMDIMKILDILEIKKLKNNYPYQLSGGEMQKVAIARAIVKNPKVLFCDEPTGAMDEKTSKKTLSLLQTINKEYNTTIIIVTHNPAIAEIANTIIKMNSGKITEISCNKNIKNAESLIWT